MSRNHHYRTLHTRDYLYRLAFCVISVTILVLGMPTEQKIGHDYKLGEPWDDSPVIATDSFRIWKSDETLARERDSLLQFYEPYFEINQSVQDEQIAAFKEDFTMNHPDVPEHYMKHIQEKLAEIYRRGVMEVSDYDEMKEEKVQYVRLYAENEAIGCPLQNLFTPKTAYEFVMDEKDTLHYALFHLQHLDLTRFISSNLRFDIEKSQQQRQELNDYLIPYIGRVKVGEKIVDRGQIVDEYTYNVLNSLEKHQQERSKTTAERLSRLGGRILYASIMTLFLLLYFQQFRNDYLERLRTVVFVTCLYLIFPLITYALVQHKLMNVLVIPYCILPIFVRIFLDSRTAFVTHMITLFTCAIALSNPFEFLVIQAFAGLTASYSLRQLTQRSDLFTTVVLVIISTYATHFCLDLIDGLFFEGKTIEVWDYIYLGIAGILSTISYLLIFAIERLFGFTSNVTLVELSNINNQILRRLSEEAPGTFQHTMQVANLAAEVANHIGAKSQLVRTGALYHDIGKLENPVFFTENQTGVNPHEGLSLEESAQIIIGHVRDGLRLAEKHKLPKVIMDFICTHHGKSMAKYFYISYKNQFPDKEIDETLFTYPGPNPATTEQAILMMADGVEAASRSLPSYTEESISALVDKIIDGQISEGYFNQCPITFLDIQAAKEVFKSKLKTIYHTRISYPELKPAAEEAPKKKKRKLKF
ncbi:MAG: HDIG domain-containing protein [Bacteroidaceae bacterium]|nr:HDIG domain-containing protein [Bacteroidaceae bacterium]